MYKLLLVLFFLPAVSWAQGDSKEKGETSVIESFPKDPYHVSRTRSKLLGTIRSEKQDRIEVYRITKEDVTVKQTISAVKLVLHPQEKPNNTKAIFIDEDKLPSFIKAMADLQNEVKGSGDFDLRVGVSGGSLGAYKKGATTRYFVDFGTGPDGYIFFDAATLTSLLQLISTK
jgi:hypothetical protein